MYDVLSDVEIERQDVELLPARTVLSLFCHASCSNTSTTSTSGTSSTPSAASTTATPTAASTTGATSSGPTVTANNIFVFLATNQYNTVTGGAAGTSGASGTGAAGISAVPPTSAS
jgi:hypothetical protein